MQNTDVFIVGHKPAVKAQPAKEAVYEDGILIHEAQPAIEAEPERKGHRVTLKNPIPFPTILKAVEFWGDDLAGTLRAGEIIVKASVIKDEEWEIVEKNGVYMMSLCAKVAGVYLTPELVEQVKKNSPPSDSSPSKTE